MKKKTQNIIIFFCLFIILFCIILFFSSSFIESDKKAINELPSQNIEKDLISIPITIKVNYSIYKISVPQSFTLYEAMQDLQKTQKFTFKTKNFTGLGQFVESINSVDSKQGFYWMYSVNGKEGTVGVSKYVVQMGDFIEWKYKKSY